MGADVEFDDFGLCKNAKMHAYSGTSLHAPFEPTMTRNILAAEMHDTYQFAIRNNAAKTENDANKKHTYIHTYILATDFTESETMNFQCRSFRTCCSQKVEVFIQASSRHTRDSQMGHQSDDKGRTQGKL